MSLHRRRSIIAGLVLTLIVAGLIPARAAVAQQTMTLPGSPPLGFQVIRQSDAKSPVVIMLHGGGGLDADQSAAFRKWSAWFANLGVTSVVIDSFGGRGLQSFHSTGDRTAYMSMLRNRVGDVQRLVNWLQAQPWVDPQRIALFGQSQGGSVAEIAALESGLQLPQILFYPGCDPKYFDSHALPASYPVSLWLLGEQDRVTPAKACQALLARMGTAARSTKVITFAGAHHTFDWPVAERNWNGSTLRYDATADNAAQSAIIAFLRSGGFIQ